MPGLTASTGVCKQQLPRRDMHSGVLAKYVMATGEQFFNLLGEVREWCGQGGLPGEEDARVAADTIGRRAWGRRQKNSDRKAAKEEGPEPDTAWCVPRGQTSLPAAEGARAAHAQMVGSGRDFIQGRSPEPCATQAPLRKQAERCE